MHFLLDPGEGMGHWTVNYAGTQSFITRNLYSLAYMKNKVENRIYLKWLKHKVEVLKNYKYKVYLNIKSCFVFIFAIIYNQ